MRARATGPMNRRGQGACLARLRGARPHLSDHAVTMDNFFGLGYLFDFFGCHYDWTAAYAPLHRAMESPAASAAGGRTSRSRAC